MLLDFTLSHCGKRDIDIIQVACGMVVWPGATKGAKKLVVGCICKTRDEVIFFNLPFRFFPKKFTFEQGKIAPENYCITL
jgi:hypothetical protein